MNGTMSERAQGLRWAPGSGEPDTYAPPETQDSYGAVLADHSLVTVDASRAGTLDLRELWTYRELLYFLMWRDIKVRYKQTALGVAWVVLLPLASALVFTVFLGRVARIGSDGMPYSLFAYSGLVIWTLFSTAVTNGASSLVGSAHLITKVYFPRIIVPAAAIAARLVDFAISSVVLIAMMVIFRVVPGWNLLMIPVLVALVTALSFAIGIWLAAVNVRYRDVGMVIPVALQLWMFASPVVYPMSFVPAEWRFAYSLNPMAGIIANFRPALYGGVFDWTSFGISAAITVVLLACAARTFGRTERNFADFI